VRVLEQCSDNPREGALAPCSAGRSEVLSSERDPSNAPSSSTRRHRAGAARSVAEAGPTDPHRVQHRYHSQRRLLVLTDQRPIVAGGSGPLSRRA